MSHHQGGGNGADEMRQFNYYGQVPNELDEIEEADVEKLEKEIEEVLRQSRT